MFELFFVAFCLFSLWSYGRAKQRGIPWFSAGSNQTTVRSRAAGRLRTHSIKPQSPWLQKREVVEPQKLAARLRTRITKPSSPWLHERKRQGSEGLAFKRLTELTHSAEVSRRLILNASDKHVGRSELWHIEKAIYDIERDRMAR